MFSRVSVRTLLAIRHYSEKSLKKVVIKLTNASGHPEIFRKQHNMFLERVIDPITLFHEGNKIVFSRHESEGLYSKHSYIFYVHPDEIVDFERKIGAVVKIIDQNVDQLRNNKNE